VAVVTRTARTPLALAIVAVTWCVLALLLATGATYPGIAQAEEKGVNGAGCVAEFGAGDSWWRLRAGGRDRDVLLHVPRSVEAGRPAPLLIALHGWASGAAQFAAVTKLSVGADGRGVVVAYPQGMGQPAGWHFAGIPSTDRLGRQADLGLFDAVVKGLTGSGCVDPGRVYVAGHSQGGGMAAELGCSRADVLAGVVMISGEHFRLPCSPTRPVSIFSLHAMDDEVLPYGGGHVTSMPAGFPPVLPTEDIAAAWARIDGCLPAVTAKDLDQGATRLTWNGCTVPVTFYRLVAGGHAWIGSGAVTTLSATDLVWSFVDASRGS
jgi:polyhydroxybutyrate depolymerase